MKTEKYTVDRIEDGIITLESCANGEIIEAPVNRFLNCCYEMDIVYVKFDSNGIIADIIVDREETDAKKEENKNKLKSLFDNI